MKVACDLTVDIAFAWHMPKRQAIDLDRISNPAADIVGGQRVMVAGDPGPVIASGQFLKPDTIVLLKPMASLTVVKPITKADHTIG